VIANLLLHQFSEVDLHALGEQLQHCRLIVACEPTRRRLSQVAYRAIAPLFGANRVTLHDAHVSISAGFRGDELPRVLGLAADRWSASVHQTWLGAYRLVAERR
jgi:hypothetical protein